MNQSYLGLGPRVEKELGEVLDVRLADGRLPILMVQKPDFHRLHASFTTSYGSMDTHFSATDGEPIAETPAGVAHFLEHKMFEKEDGDVMHRFSSMGCSSNAMTSFNTTSYIIDCTDDYRESLDLLVDFVLTPYFTQELVDKEQGIIAEEIRMYDDDPGWRGFKGVLKLLYPASHPLSHDIAGTVESIAEIDHRTLRRCYDAFYRPENMLLSLAGDFDPEEVSDRVGTRVAACNGAASGSLRRKPLPRTRRVARKRGSSHMPINSKRLFFGWRGDLAGDESELTPLELECALDMFLGATLARGSSLYEELYNSGLIDDTFHHMVSIERGFAFVIATGNTPDPAALAARLRRAFAEGAHQVKADSADLRRMRRDLLGSFIKGFDSVDAISANLIECELKGQSLFDYGKIVRGLSEECAVNASLSVLRPEASAAYVVLPSE